MRHLVSKSQSDSSNSNSNSNSCDEQQLCCLYRQCPDGDGLTYFPLDRTYLSEDVIVRLWG